MVVSVAQSIDFFFSLRHGKKSVVSVVFAPLRDFLLLRHVLKANEIKLIEYGRLVWQKN